uniref:Uncharacterized protein n=1 Tax=Rhodnius prolixus TaxID=13249 RepID=T1I991_RHOPR
MSPSIYNPADCELRAVIRVFLVLKLLVPGETMMFFLVMKQFTQILLEVDGGKLVNNISEESFHPRGF